MTKNDPVADILLDDNQQTYDLVTHTTKTVKKVHRFFINTGIYNDSAWLIPLLKLLNGTNENPEHSSIEIYLESGGGSIYTAEQIIASTHRSKLPIHIYVDGVCCSAATMILLAGKYETINISDNATFLFHDGSLFTFGKIGELRDIVDHNRLHLKRITERCYKDILTTEELEQIELGKELYMFGDEVKKRIANKQAKLTKVTKPKRKTK